MNACIEDSQVLAHESAAYTSVTLDLYVVSEAAHDLLDLLCELASGSKDQALAFLQGVIKIVKNAGAERRSLSCS